jgi:phage-related minor tail protein
MADDGNVAGELPVMIERVDMRMLDLTRSASAFSRAMTGAFAQSVTGARGFDETLRSVGLRLSGLAVQTAFKPLANLVSNGFAALFQSAVSMPQTTDFKAAFGAIKPFAAGGVIGTPSYFPLASGGVGLAGEAGPEAIMPLARGQDGRLGVTAGRGNPSHVTVNITTPDAESFRRSEVFLTGQIARAVARGQRGL